MKEPLFRGKSNFNNSWVEGYYWKDKFSGSVHIVIGEAFAKTWVKPETVGQLRYENKHGRYFDGDVFILGHGKVIVSELCELQSALLDGYADDIGAVIGNVFDNPEMKDN